MVRKKAIRKKRVKASAEDAIDWMKHHTIEDAKELVCEISSKGEDANDMVTVVRELEDIVHDIESE